MTAERSELVLHGEDLVNGLIALHEDASKHRLLQFGTEQDPHPIKDRVESEARMLMHLIAGLREGSIDEDGILDVIDHNVNQQKMDIAGNTEPGVRKGLRFPWESPFPPKPHDFRSPSGYHARGMVDAGERARALLTTGERQLEDGVIFEESTRLGPFGAGTNLGLIGPSVDDFVRFNGRYSHLGHMRSRHVRALETVKGVARDEMLAVFAKRLK
ncbi:hypothetical protein HOG48_01795 [Candidatus Peregrinibacteria bacterium]|jgi:hypothetical protein|nr:hypothetical protein [Candidatus Peregrinibacteria bacterium]